MSKLKDEIKNAVSECGLDVKFMAKMTGLNRSTVERYIKGQTGSNLDKLETLLEIAGYKLTLTPIDPHMDKYRSQRRLPPPPLD
jgi:predicted transcriptional regulator